MLYTVGVGDGQHMSFWQKVSPIAIILAQVQHQFDSKVLAIQWSYCRHCCPLPVLLIAKTYCTIVIHFRPWSFNKAPNNFVDFYLKFSEEVSKKKFV
jgi:hypothetical protein